MSETTLVGNEKLKTQFKEVISKAKKLVNMKEVQQFVGNSANHKSEECVRKDLGSQVAEDMDDFLSWLVEKDSVKKLKRELEGWREILLHLNSVLLWEKPWYPGMIAGVTTMLFTVLWVMEPSLLTTVSVAGLVMTLLDFLVPTVAASLYSPAHWTGAMERQYELICSTLVRCYSLSTQQLTAFFHLKVTSPKLYYGVTIITLIALSYIGNLINNLVLTYFLVTALLLVPGLVHHGILHKYYQMLLQSVSKVLKGLQGGDKLKVN